MSHRHPQPQTYTRKSIEAEPNFMKCSCDECASAEERNLKHTQDQLLKQQKKFRIISDQVDLHLDPKAHTQDLRLRNTILFLQRDIEEGLRITERNLDKLTHSLNNPSNFKTHQEAQTHHRLRTALQPAAPRSVPFRPTRPSFPSHSSFRPLRRDSAWAEPRFNRR